ncbi:MAG: septum formation protein Maf [Rhodospirillales bacterium]|nr:septum formation protein Maf [Rhodospirillales bacterium]MDE2391898.1 septum formation protein Maf [Rhodospirillales bacterium]
MPLQIILASASPRRLALLRQINIEPARIIAPEIDETPRPGELPRVYARRMALEKLPRTPDGFVVAADTVVAAGRRILHKTESRETAERYLRLLSGRRHKVHSAVAVAAPDGRTSCRVVESVVGFARLDEPQLQAYLASGEWQGKAGGYAIQGQAANFIDFISGSYSGVVGLPLHETSTLLRGLGWR